MLRIASAYVDLLVHLCTNFGRPIDLDTIQKAFDVRKIISEYIETKTQG